MAERQKSVEPGHAKPGSVVRAGGGGFEPPLTDPESAVLPLDDPPIYLHPIVSNLATADKVYQELFGLSKARQDAFWSQDAQGPE